MTSITVLGALSADDRERLAVAGLDVAPVSLQQLIVRLTQHTRGDAPIDTVPTTDEGALR